MSIHVKIRDSQGKTVTLDDEGQIPVVVHPHPPRNEDQEGAPRPFRSYFTDDGSPTGTSDMAVLGTSAAPEEFYISAVSDYDIYIKSISVVIGDGGTPTLNQFGALGSALTNGVQWEWLNNIDGTYELHEGIKTNLEFVRLGVDTGAVGTGADSYLADVAGGAGTEKSYLPIIDVKETFGLQWGIRLVKGTKDRLSFKVRDDLTGLTTFNIIAYGIRF